MKLFPIPRPARATLGTVVGGLSLASGSAVVWGIGVGLMVGGALAAVYSAFVYDVDDQ